MAEEWISKENQCEHRQNPAGYPACRLQYKQDRHDGHDNVCRVRDSAPRRHNGRVLRNQIAGRCNGSDEQQPVQPGNPAAALLFGHRVKQKDEPDPDCHVYRALLQRRYRIKRCVQVKDRIQNGDNRYKQHNRPFADFPRPGICIKFLQQRFLLLFIQKLRFRGNSFFLSFAHDGHLRSAAKAAPVDV